MNDIQELARGMAAEAMNEGCKLAYNVAINFCESVARAYAARGDQEAMTGAQDCVTGLKQIRDTIVARESAANSPTKGEKT